MKRFLAGSIVGLFCGAAMAQGADRTLEFSLDRPGPPLVHYTVLLHENGAGTYVSQPAATPNGADAHPGPKEIRVSPAVIKKVFAAVPTVEGGRCETHSKNLAKTGVKVLHYVGAGKDAQCTFNFSDDDRVNDAAQAFEAVAETMQYGDRLRTKLRFDRLGLDAELEGLQSAVQEGRALDLGNIAPVLKSIGEDERVMDRVRRKVERLLQSAGSGQTGAGADASDR